MSRPPSLAVREVTCKSVLHEMEKGTGEYTANFYRGCSHGCVYCYAPSLIHEERRWGSYVDIKTNAPRVLARELREVRRKRRDKGMVFLSSASDPYQPAEARYMLTRRSLAELVRSEFPVAVLTRSPLVLRDIDLLKRLSWVRVGVSISSVPGRTFEPGVVPVARRVEVLRALSRAGIKTWVSLAPLVPGLMEIDLRELLVRLKEAGVSCVSAGILRFQGYPRSKELFEEVSGVPSETLLVRGQDVLDQVDELTSGLGFEPRERLFDWRAEVTLQEHLSA